MDQWEYHFERLPGVQTPIEEILARFNELGAQGWQACEYFPAGHMMFKRKTGGPTA